MDKGSGPVPDGSLRANAAVEGDCCSIGATIDMRQNLPWHEVGRHESNRLLTVLCAGHHDEK